MGNIPQGDELKPLEGGGYKSTKTSGPLRHLWPHHMSMARMAACGAQPKDIALQSGFTPGQVSRILGSPLFQAEVLRLQDTIEEIAVSDVQEQLKLMASRAVEVLDEDLHCPAVLPAEKKIRQAAAFDVLNRAGHKAPDSGNSQHLHFHQHKEVAKNTKTEDILAEVLELTND